MAFDEAAAQRLRRALRGRRDLTERKMFGGLAFLADGAMCCGLLGDRLVLRLGETGAAKALREPHTRPMDFTGRPMKTMIYVEPLGYETDADLRRWLRRAAASSPRRK